MMDSTPYSEGVICVTVEKSQPLEDEKVESNQCELPSVESLKDQLQKAETEVAALRESLSVKMRLVQDLKRQLKVTEVPSIKRESSKCKVKKYIVDTLNSITQDIPTMRVTRLSETQDSNETKVDTVVKLSKIKQEISKYQPGDKIFAKVKGFVYWPSRINPIPEDIPIPPNKIPIFFYGTHEVFFISPSFIWPFEKNKNKWGKPTPRAHFNQALDEIENNPTLFQYGADPDAEDFLGQFYQFKRSNGETSSGMKSNEEKEDVKSDFINDDNKSSKSKTDSVKKRHASSSSSFKLKEEDSKPDMKKNEPKEKRNSLNLLHKTREKKSITNEIDDVESQEKREVFQRRTLKKNTSTKKLKSKRSFTNEPDKNEEILVIMSSDTEINERQSMKTRNFSGSSLKTIEELNTKNVEESLKQEKMIGNIACGDEMKDTHSFTIIEERKIDGLDEVRQKEDLLNVIPEKENDKKELLRLRNVSGASLKSNEERRNVGQREGSNAENLENITPENSKKDSLRKRNSSGSSIITRRKSDAQESQNNENELVTTGNDVNHKELSRKRNSSGVVLSLQEVTKMDSAEENKAIIEIDNEKPQKSECVLLSRLRSRSLSISNETKKGKSSSKNVAKKEIDSDAVLSDNPKDEDFKPTKKSSRMPKKSSVKISKVKKIESKAKSKGKPKNDKKTKKKNVSESDSISSISSVEDWKERDATKGNEHDAATNNSENEKLPKDDLSIKKSDKFEEENTCVQIRLTDMTHSNKLMNVVEREEVSHEDKEVVVEISITDIGKGDADLKESEITTLKNIANDGLMINKDNIETDKLNLWKDIANESKPLKQINTEKVSPKKKTTNSCKRRRLDTDEIEDTPFERKNKRAKSSRIKDDDSDIEIMDVKLASPTIAKKDVLNNVSEVKLSSLTIPKKDVAPNNVVVVSSPSDKIKTLQACNSDIRSSLVLGHEDYEKCVEKFKSLCTMDLDLISLVTVWQLMDTVKKCRRYKRNEAVKNEAQNAYKRFMDIYSQSTVDEVLKAQLSLAHNKLKPDTYINGQSQNPNIPSSVEDMFHHHNNNKREFETPQSNIESTPKDNSQPATNDEEKMRLLSADLEAKVSDIMNKIERNTSTLNPINRQSMTHLLPSRTEDSMIQLPVTWESVDSNNQFHHHHNNNYHHHHHHYQQQKSHSNLSRNKVKIISDDEDDEDDVDAIVKRIEEIPIPQMDVEEEEDEREDGILVIANDHTNTPSTTTSALDARIQNLFNTALIADTKTKKPRVPSRPYGHKPSAVTRDMAGSRSPSSSTRYMISPNKTSPHKDIQNKSSLTTKEDLTRPIHSTTASVPTTTTTTTSTTTKVNVTEHNILDSTDNVIYNLLGV